MAGVYRKDPRSTGPKNGRSTAKTTATAIEKYLTPAGKDYLQLMRERKETVKYYTCWKRKVYS